MGLGRRFKIADRLLFQISRKPGENMRSNPFSIFFGVVFGFLLGVSFPTFCIMTKMNTPASLFSSENILHFEEKNTAVITSAPLNVSSPGKDNGNVTDESGRPAAAQKMNDTKIWVPTNPRGAEMLAPGIVEAESDFYPRRLWGNPSEDLPNKPKYLITFTVGYSMKNNINKAIKKFSQNFTVLLFHYDGRTSEWNEFEWSKRAIHVSVARQTKWWYAKRFLHPDIVAAYDYIFIWDEDLGVEHFNAEKYIQLVRKHGLEISQPGLDPSKGLTWQMTMRREDHNVHKSAEIKKGWCTDPHLPPCAAFVEIMAPVFSRDAWRCVWHLIQNDLVHGWGLDFSLRRCVEPAHEKIGVVDSEWIVHQTVPSLGNQGKSEEGKPAWQGVRDRCNYEWMAFQKRVAIAESEYYRQTRGDSSNATAYVEERDRQDHTMDSTQYN